MAKDTLTVRGAIINLCNTCIGTGILAKPFALAVAGWFGVFSFAVAAILITYIGVCLSDASRELLMNNKSIMLAHKTPNYNTITAKNDGNTPFISTKKPQSDKSAYQLISYRSMGTKGEAFSVIGFAIVVSIFLATCIIMIFELLTDIKNEIFPTIFNDTRLIFLFSFIFYIPTTLILNWTQMTFVSWIGVLSVLSIFISLICVLIYSLYMFDFGPPPKQLLISRINDINSANLATNANKNMSEIGCITFAFVLFLFGVSGNAAIPKISTSIENKNKNDIIFVVTASYISVSIFYGIIACIAYWIYGEYTDVMILNSLYIWPGGKIVVIVFVLVILNVWASFAIMMSLYGDLGEGIISIKNDQYGYRRLFRMIILGIIFVCAYFLRYNLTFLVALTSSFGVLFSLALTLPIIVYLCTFWDHENKTKQLSIYSKIFHLLLLILCIAVGIYVSFNDIINVL